MNDGRDLGMCRHLAVQMLGFLANGIEPERGGRPQPLRERRQAARCDRGHAEALDGAASAIERRPALALAGAASDEIPGSGLNARIGAFSGLDAR